MTTRYCADLIGGPADGLRLLIECKHDDVDPPQELTSAARWGDSLYKLSVIDRRDGVLLIKNGPAVECDGLLKYRWATEEHSDD